MDKKQALKIIQKYVRRLCQEGISVDRVILYGSYAAGRERYGSDIDVALCQEILVKTGWRKELPFTGLREKWMPDLNPCPSRRSL